MIFDLSGQVPEMSCLTRLEEELEVEKNDEMEGFSMNLETNEDQLGGDIEEDEQVNEREEKETHLTSQESAEVMSIKRAKVFSS